MTSANSYRCTFCGGRLHLRREELRARDAGIVVQENWVCTTPTCFNNPNRPPPGRLGKLSKMVQSSIWKVVGAKRRG